MADLVDVNAESENLYQAGQIIGVLKPQLAQYEKVLKIIGLRSKLEGIVDKLYPLRINSKTNETMYGKPDSSTCDALNEMLTSQSDQFVNDPFISMFRNRLLNDYQVNGARFHEVQPLALQRI